jgi:hypothetical protein
MDRKFAEVDRRSLLLKISAELPEKCLVSGNRRRKKRSSRALSG